MLSALVYIKFEVAQYVYYQKFVPFFERQNGV